MARTDTGGHPKLFLTIFPLFVRLLVSLSQIDWSRRSKEPLKGAKDEEM